MSDGGSKMNHIYKVVWSKVKNCYVVVSEIARSNGKTRSQKVVAVLGTALISSVLFTGGGQFEIAEAAPHTIGGYTFDDTTISIATSRSTVSSTGGSKTIALGNKTRATGANSVALGDQNEATGDNAIAFGGGYNKATKSNTASGTASVAFGEGTQALSEGSVAFGNGTQAGNTEIDPQTKKNSGQDAVAFGNGTKALGGRSLAFGEKTIAKYNDSVAFGDDTRASSTGATAFGNRTRALSQYATAWGNATVAADAESTAWGTDTIAGAKLDENGAVTNIYTYKNNPNDKTEEEKTATEKMDVHGNLAYLRADGTTAGIKQMDIGGKTEKHDYVVLAGKDGNTYVRDYQGSLWKVNVAADGTVTVDTTAGTKGKVYNGQKKTSLAKTTVDGSEVDINPDNVLTKAHEGSNGYTIDGYANATAFGYSTEASGDNATAFGNDTKAKAAAATAFGKTTTASGDNATAFGLSTTASGKQTTAFGSSTTASGDNATAFGNDTKAKASAATAFGTTTTASGDNATAFGLSTTASGKQTTAFGSSTTASGDNATAFGKNSTASGEAATAFGIGSTASGKNSLAGLGGTASNENSIALGKDTKADNADSAVSVAIGQNAEASGAQSLAIGFGNVSETNQSGNTPYPVSATQAAAKGAIAIGINTGAKGEHSIAMGSHTDAAKDSSVAIGFDTHAVEDSSVAIGSGTKAAGRYSVALGLSSIAGTETNDEKNPLDGGGSVAMGYATSAEASRSIAIGTGATAADSQFTTAVGDSTTAQAEGSVAIGAGSIATRGAGNKESIVSTDINTGKTTITYGDEKRAYLKPDTLSTDKISTWGSTTGAVSVGGQATYKEYDDNGNLVKKTKLLTRQITNVAAGSDDTDAVNVAQLKAAQPTVTSNDHSVTIATSTDLTDYHKNYDLKIATATLSPETNGSGNSAVATGKVTVTNPTYTGSDGKPVTNENAYVTGNSVADAINNSGFKLTASASEGAVTGNKETLIHPGDTMTIDAGKNISLTQDKGKISIATKENLNLGSADSKDDKQQDVPGTNGSITVNGKNGSSVAINGQDGSIGLTGPKGTDGTSTSIQMSTIMSDPTLDDGKNTKTTSDEGEQQTTTTQAPRIQYKNGNTTYEVATMDDGQKYAGDVQASDAKANAFSRKLNEQTNIVGGVKNLDALSTGNNVGVVSNGTDTLTIRLAKELTDLTSVTTVTKDAQGNKTSETVQDGNGITITPTTLGEGKSSVSLTDKGLSNGGNQITHVDSGLKDTTGNTVDLAAASGDVLNNAVNVGDLQNVQKVASAHTAVTVNGSVEAPAVVADGKLGNYTDKEKGNLLLAQKKDTTTGKITYDLKLNDKVILGKDTSDGKDGQEGTIGLTGKDGLPGTDGKQGYSTTIIKTEKGQKGKDGKTGKENLGGTDINRIVYTDKDGRNPQTVATMDDGQKYGGDNYVAATDKAAEQNVITKKLNERLDIQGGADKDKLTEQNIGVNVKDGVMKVQLAQNLNLTGNGSVTMGNTIIDNGGVTITTKNGDNTNTISLTDNGLNNGGKTITNVAGGTNLTDAVNVSQLNAAKTTVTSNDHSVTIDTTTDSTDKHKNYDLKIATATLSQDKTTGDNPVETGKVTVSNPKISVTENGETKQVDNPNAYVTGNSVADAINNSGFTLTTSKSEGGSVSGTSTTLIKPGSTVTLNAGKNIAMTQADSKVTIALSDDVTAQTITANGKNGNDGEIGLTGKNGADGTVTTIIKTIGKNGTDGKNGTPGVNGTDGITRIVYQDGKDGEAGTTTHTVATLDDGLKFIGDKTDDKAIAKKLGDILKIKGDGTYDAATQTNTSNIQTSVDGDAIKVALNKDINLKQDGSLTVGGNTQDGSKTVDNPIVIKHFGDKTLDMITGVDKDGKPISANKKAAAGDYVTGLDNKDWNVDSPTYVSGRAATEDQLKTISDAVKEASTTAGKHTVVTVEGGKDAGTTDYNGENLKLKVTDTAGQKTYDLKLSDKLNLGTVGKDGEKGTDGSIGLKGADGKSSIGLNGKDGISVIGKDGKNGVSITGSNGLNGKDGIDGKIAIGTPGKDGQPGKDAVSISGQNGIGHIGLTGQRGEDGKDGVFTDLSTTLGTATLDPAKNEQSKSADKVNADDKSSRIQYQTTVTDKDGKTKTVITHEVATMDDGQKYAGDFGDGASVKLNKTVNVKGNAKKEADLTDGNIGVVSSQSGDNGQLLIKLNKDLNLGDNGSVKMGNTTINNDGMTISKTESGKTTTVTLTDKGLNNGGNKITNVAAGTDGTDAVNVSQLNDVKTLAGQHTTVEAGSKNITVKEGTNSTGGKNYTIDLAKDVAFGDAAKGDKTVAISGTNGTVMAGTGDNKVTVDGSKGQIVAGGDNGVKIGNIAEGDSRLTIYDKDGKATNQTDKAGKYVTNLDNKTWKDDGSYVSGRAATEDQLHQVESNVNKQIADVNTKIDKVDKHHTEVTVNGGTAAKADGSYTDGNLQLKQTTGEDGQKVYDLKLNDQLKVGQKGDAGTAGKDGNVTVETKGGTTVVIGHDGKDGKDGRDGLFVNGKDGKDGKSGVSITGPNGVAGRDGVDGKVGIAGTDGRDAVSIAGRDGVGHIGLTGPKGADGKDGAFTDLSTILGQATLDPAKNVKGKDGDAKDEKASRIHYETTVATKDGEKTVSHEVATMDDGMKYSGDSGSAAVKLNNNVQLYGGAKEYAAGDNIGVVVSQDGDNAKMQVKLAKDLKGIDSIDAKTVTTGNTTINNGGLTVKGDDKHKDITVQQGAVNMGGNKIEGVAPGRIAPDSTDAVNGSQLAQRDQAIGKLGGEVSNLDRRVDRVGAGAAALAALHPQDFDPDDKWDFAVGYGNYRGANAAAVGAFYRPNEDTTLSVGGTVGGGENMVNAGISFKFGQGNHVTNSRVAMAKEILALKDYVQKQDEKIEKLEALVGTQGTANAPKRRSILFPDVPENHWAYAYVKKLADRGLLEGYPDGEFKGTRTITRYEFAAIFSRALENGVSVDGDMERMSEEFEPEIRELSLNRFRVDRVEGDDNDRHKIERVRVNDRDELVKQKNGEQKKRYRDVYGSVIEKDAPSDAVK